VHESERLPGSPPLAGKPELWRPLSDPVRPDWAPAAAAAPGRPWRHVVLLALTVLTTTLVGALHYASFLADFRLRAPQFTVGLLLNGFWYSGTILAILGCHEMGHYLACRFYRVDASLPYFIPAPILTGTLGAFIRIRQPIPSKRQLFDIGIAGPIAGFLVAIPVALVSPRAGMACWLIAAVPTRRLSSRWAARHGRDR
jgi:hypothetical protein